MAEYKIAIAIITASFATLLIRVLPTLCLARRSLPEPISNILLFIPPAIMTSITASEVINDKALIPGSIIPVAIPSAILAFIIGYPSRSLFVTILVGVLSFLAFQHLDIINYYIMQFYK